MKPAEIAARRLVNQYLVAPEFVTAKEVVSRLGAVQAQDYGGAKWALSQRTAGLTDAEVEREISTGHILRTHVLRPTWHFVVASDIRWMLELTSKRINASMAASHRRLELDDTEFKKSRRVLAKVLGDGSHRTRDELARAFSTAKIAVDDRLRLMHLMMRAELDGVVCSGDRKGKQFTYALLDQRVPAIRRIDRDEALSELARTFFTTRGPATLDDFAWWSGLTKTDGRRGVAGLGLSLREEMYNGKSHYAGAVEPSAKLRGAQAHLLPNYDEWFIGFKDRSAAADRLHGKGVTPRLDGVSGNLLTMNGQIVGGWTRALGKDLSLSITLLDSLTARERSAVDAAVRKFGQFFGIPARWTSVRQASFENRAIRKGARSKRA
ncbi:MAG TPA: winged helix DNA-binding domain-containing protein [Gemmatimonadaceae bacterium]|jgi:hypothetical protein